MDRHFYEEEIIKKVAGPYLRNKFAMPRHRFFQGNAVQHSRLQYMYSNNKLVIFKIFIPISLFQTMIQNTLQPVSEPAFRARG